MIRLDRSALVAPDKLAEGKADLERLRPLAEAGTLKSRHFDSTIYGAAKEALWRSQGMKCCYCEQACRLKHNDLEHFRPKSEAIRGGGARQLGYWWLAYEFENLYFSCRCCNAAKSSHFPLSPGATPLEPGQLPSLHDEGALLLDPGSDDPSEHIAFVEDPMGGYHVAPLDESERGKATIRILQLDSDDLREIRRRYFRDHIEGVIKSFRDAIDKGDAETVARARSDAERLTKPDAMFSMMARAAFQHEGVL